MSHVETEGGGKGVRGLWVVWGDTFPAKYYKSVGDWVKAAKTLVSERLRMILHEQVQTLETIRNSY